MMVRVVRQTVLFVGEGYAAEAFLKHLRDLYTSRAEGRSLTVRNARGEGAASVISETGRIARRLPHSFVASLFDADAERDGRVAEEARKKKIVPVSCNPCIEAVLLRMHGDAEERDSGGHKKVFEQRFGVPAHDARAYLKYFPREFLDAARATCPQLHELLTLLGC
jgi:hypothetical protein